MDIGWNGGPTRYKSGYKRLREPLHQMQNAECKMQNEEQRGLKSWHPPPGVKNPGTREDPRKHWVFF